MIGRHVSRFRIVEKLGEGGRGVVYKAEDPRLGRPVALKFLRPEALRDEREKALLLREARAAAALDHPNVCTVHEIDEVDGRVFIVMAFVEGRSLDALVRDGVPPLDRAVDLATQVARGLEAAHRRGLVHRDVKSKNVLVTPDGRAKLVDFGLAVAAESEASDTAVVEGTPAFMSPEQLRGEPLDARSDVWSWGVLLYELLTGRHPFERRHPGQVVFSVLHEDAPPLPAGVPAALAGILGKALSKRREDRYGDATELLADLGALAAGGPVRLPSAGRPGGARRSIAVLPFSDMSPGGDQEYFCDGLAEEIIGSLTHVTGLQVASRTSSFAYKGRPGDVRAIGKQLGVDTVLEGSVRKAGDRLRITCQLIDVREGYHLWSHSFDRELEDVFAIQEEIAQCVAGALEVRLSEREERALACCETRDVEAYDLYLKGRQFFYRSKRADIEYALEMFSRAVERDPSYARAHAGLADCHSYLFAYFGGDAGDLAMADAASAEALRLDPGLAEAHASRGLALSHARRYDEAEREFLLAIRANPRLFEAYYFYARSCFAQGRAEDAARLYEQASRVNTADLQALSLLAFTYHGMGRHEEGLDADRRSLARIERHLELNPDDARAYYLGATALQTLGDEDRCWEWAARALEIGADDPYTVYGLACLSSKAGRADEAVDYLTRAVERGFAHREWIEQDTDLDPVRDDPRVRALVEGLASRRPTSRPS